MKKKLIIIAILGLLAFWIFLSGISTTALWEEDEVWYAQVAREMVLNKNYVTPTFAGEPFFHKPPLFFWGLAVSGKILGFSELSARLVSAGAAVLTVILTFLTASLLFSNLVGVVAGLILATSFQFMLQARLAYLDPLLTFFITLAMYNFVRGYLAKRPINYVWFYVAMGLATLTKGPIGLLLPAGAVFLFLLLRREFVEVKNAFLNWGIIPFGLIVLPWYVLETVIHGWAFLQDHFGYHMLARFAQGIETHTEPWYYYIVILFIGFLPWSTFLPAALLYARRMLKKKEVLLTVLWAAIIFVFFSISKSKLPGYILPSLVPFSILVSATIVTYFRGEDGVTWRGMFGSLSLLFLLLAGLSVFFLFVVNSVAHGVQDLLAELGPMVWILGIGALAIFGAFLLKPRRGYFLIAIVLWAVILNIYFVNQVLPLAESIRYMKPLGEKLSIISDAKIANYDYYSRGLLYYSKAADINVVRSNKEIADWLNSSEKVYLVMSEWQKNKLIVKKVLQENSSAKVFYRSHHGVIITN